MTKKSLQSKYRPAVEAGASFTEVKNSITTTETALTPEEIDEFLRELYDDVEKEQQDMAPEEEEEVTADPAPATPVNTGATHPMLKGKKFYDIFRGKWIPLEVVTGYDGKDVVVLWEFEREGKPIRTGVPMEPDRVQAFNDGRKVRAVNTFVEQMIEVGYTGKVYDQLPDPTKRRKINLR